MRRSLATLMELSLNLAAAIRDRRIELGLSQAQLAERIGPQMQQADISRLERGLISLPKPELLKLLAAALETTVPELLNNAGWLTNQELARYASTAVPETVRPLVCIASADLGTTTSFIDRLSANAFRFLVALDARTLFDVIAGQQPDVVIVGPAAPPVSLADLANLLWTNRLDATVIVIGRSGTELPAHFHFLDTPVTSEALWNVLSAAGYEDL